ncbi:tetratricopeptide repeat protein [Pseudoroseomonas globiformis]|uniref:Tetratricopeptide repeat protein n=1 Tax=Teichococcus globiformis TaxID=2307229 RepID=A0ABV7G3Y8_9PROT
MPVQHNPETAEAWLRQGMALHQHGRLAEAAALYRQVLSLRPRDANALNLLGTVARQSGDLPDALRLIRRAVGLAPEAPVFLASLGGTLAEAGQLEAAARALRAALERRPEDATALRNLGQVLCGLGRPGEALAPLRQAVALAPGQAEPHLALAHAAREAGQAEEAVNASRMALALPELTPELAEQARFLLAALGEAAAPHRAPAAYVRELFDQYAPRFDTDLQERLGYRTPALLAALLERSGVAPAGQLDVLDLGCGTGLSGRALKPFARRLEGMDLSPRMLAEAHRTGLYDQLREADLLEALPRCAGRFDLVAAADVLNYLGELRPALAGMAAALRPGGVLAFSIESGTGGAYALGPGLRYRHDPDAVLASGGGLGLKLLAREEAVLRRERGANVAGQLLLLGMA